MTISLRSLQLSLRASKLLSAGRVDDVINVSGHRIGTAEVEGALTQHPQCAEAAVVPVEHPIKGQGIYAYVTLMVVRTRAAPRCPLYRYLSQCLSCFLTSGISSLGMSVVSAHVTLMVVRTWCSCLCSGSRLVATSGVHSIVVAAHRPAWESTHMPLEDCQGLPCHVSDSGDGMMQGTEYPPPAQLKKELVATVREVIGPIATPDVIHWAPGTLIPYQLHCPQGRSR